MRPKKIRLVKYLPAERCFRPKCKPLSQVDSTYLTIDEFEALRLADLVELNHAQAAKKMKISRPTFTRILASAHKKMADGLVNIKAIRIEGGCCKITGRIKK